jgi:hypothetical protein
MDNLAMILIKTIFIFFLTNPRHSQVKRTEVQDIAVSGSDKRLFDEDLLP